MDERLGRTGVWIGLRAPPDHLDENGDEREPILGQRVDRAAASRLRRSTLASSPTYTDVASGHEQAGSDSTDRTRYRLARTAWGVRPVQDRKARKNEFGSS